MSFLAGNRSAVNRRTRQRFSEAKDLIEGTGDIAEDVRSKGTEFLDRSTRQKMARNVSDVIEARNVTREREEKALERVKEVTGDNPMAVARAELGFMSDADLKEQHGFFADERIGITEEEKRGRLGIETTYLSQLSHKNKAMADLLSSFREEVDPGWGGAILGAVGSIAGGFIGCWVAREIYGQDNPKWMLFRAWLLEDAPRWFVDLYMKHGERFAKFISNKPWLKAIIRRWMDKKIAGRMIKVPL